MLMGISLYIFYEQLNKIVLMFIFRGLENRKINFSNTDKTSILTSKIFFYLIEYVSYRNF